MLTTMARRRPADAPPPGAVGQEWRCKPWLCDCCGAALGELIYARRQPVALHPTAPLLSVNGGVLTFACPQCQSVQEWRIVRAA